MRRIAPLVFAGLLSFSLISSALAVSPKGVVPLAGVEADLPDTELRVLDRLVSGAKVVALGESVHGSAGFLKLQHRITKYLVERKGFRLVVLENPVIRSAGITRWLTGCASGTSSGKPMPIDLLYSPIAEDRDFLGWICDFNRRHRRDPIRFRGMDIWDRPWEHQIRMEKIAKTLRLDFAADLALTRKHCWAHGDNDWSNWTKYMEILKRERKIPPADYVPCSMSLSKMEAAVDQFLRGSLSARDRYAAHTLIQSIQSAFGFQGNYNFRYVGPDKGWNSRDLAQAKNEFRIWEQEGKRRMVLIAHTSHTTKMESGSDWWKMGKGAFKSGLYYLKQRMGNSVRTIGLTGYDVTGSQGTWDRPENADSLDLELHKRGFSVAYVDPYSRFVLQRNRWWVQNENSAKDHYRDGVYMVPRDNFDAFIFVDKTHIGEKILPWREVFRW